ncbi:MAG: MerR family transcriptional regulator [Dehalococcoidia bacterium]|nr:MerR family transcriptional regulator [Dehalococcoidia bacterium]
MAKGNKHFLSVGEFAKLSRTTKATLWHYDKIGLLSPVSRGEDSKYRYYRSEQTTTVHFIRTFQLLGMSLEEIKNLKTTLNPKTAEKFFMRQLETINMKIDEMVRTKKLILTLKKSMESVANINEKEITAQYMPEEAIILGGLNDYSRGRDGYDALLSFYHEMSKQHTEVDLNYSVWGILSKESILREDYVHPDRLYFYNPDGHDRKPAALYAIGYNRSWYGEGGELYKRLLAYIEKNGYEICGDFYEEHPLNEICIGDANNYLMRVMVPIRKKRGKKTVKSAKK